MIEPFFELESLYQLCLVWFGPEVSEISKMTGNEFTEFLKTLDAISTECLYVFAAYEDMVNK